MTDLQVPSVAVSEVIDGPFQVVDVRSPAEYAEGHMPGALNMPLLDDTQRAAVGITYKHEGAPQARLKALDEVAPSLSQYLHDLAALAAAQPRGRRLAIMCWRGGERSRNVVLLLALIGIHAVAVRGGYRAYRKELLAALDAWRPPVPVVTLHGHTGVGKSALLRGLTEIASPVLNPCPWPLDLEHLAAHRGSLLGGLNQPTERRQKDFDALLWEELRHPRGDYLVVEGEGGKIGRIFVPRQMAEAIRRGIPVLVKAPLEDRVKRILAEYRPERWDPAEVRSFRRGLTLIAPHVPRRTSALVEAAFAAGRFADVVRELLVGYYDPLYERSSVEGRRFAWEFETGFDPRADAHRFAQDMADLIKEVSSTGFPT